MENNQEFKIERKIFWPWQDDKEEAWLSEMASKGLHFLSYEGFNKYKFVIGEPKKVRYCLDYIANSQDEENYKKMFEDDGWKHVGKVKGWQYFKKEYEGDEFPEIFTDKDSKIEKYYRVLGSYSFAFLLLMLINYFTIMHDYLNLPEFVEGMIMGIGSIASLFFVFCVSSVLGKIRQYKN